MVLAKALDAVWALKCFDDNTNYTFPFPTNEWHFDWRLSPTSLVSFSFFAFFCLHSFFESLEESGMNKVRKENGFCAYCSLMRLQRTNPSWTQSWNHSQVTAAICSVVMQYSKNNFQHHPWPYSVHYPLRLWKSQPACHASHMCCLAHSACIWALLFTTTSEPPFLAS